MISYKEAIDIIHIQAKKLAPQPILLKDALGCILAEDVIAPIDIPGFNQSAMDGYALRLADHDVKDNYLIEGEIAAGDNPNQNINNDIAVRIFTGAAIPEGFDTVVMQEKTTVNEGHLYISDELIKTGQNIRLKGAEIKKGSIALTKGSVITPASIGFLASLGITAVNVIPKPKVTLIITGNELMPPGTPLAYGQIYDSNSYTLSAALQQKGIQHIEVIWMKDDLSDLAASLDQAIIQSDLVLLTGGISVGKYDFVLQANEINNVVPQFYKIKQRPGKPLYFGTKNNKLIFGLPGNPASVLTCFYVYVATAIDLITGQNQKKWTKAILGKEYSKNTNLTHFLKGHFYDGKVTIMDGQESFKLSSFAYANCLVKIDESATFLSSGDEVEVLLLDI